MKKINYIVILFFCLLLNACDFKDTNIDPNRPSDAPLASLLPAAQVNLAYGIGGDLSQYCGVLTQHLAGVNRLHLDVARYNITPGVSARSWENNFYPGAMMEFDLIIKKATAQNSPYYRGVSKILMAVALGHVCDIWNDVPYSQAFDINNLKPKYDKGEQVYASIQKLLAEGITDLQSTTSALTPTTDDVIFRATTASSWTQTSRLRWINTARVLQARYHNHLSKVDPQGSAQKALDALTAGSFNSNADDAAVVFGATQNAASPWFSLMFGTFGDNVLMGKHFIDLLQNTNDPRLPFFSATVTGGRYVGIAAGDNNPSGSRIGSYFNRTDAPVNIASFIEAKFIEAEANHRLGRFEQAANAYNTAVKASILKITRAANPTYETANASETASSIAGAEGLKKIMTQKYIALFTEPETWTDWRRTNIPQLTVAINNFTSGQFPRRWPYPQSEINNNPEAVNSASPSGVTDRVWWDK